jgi:DNA-binding NarL/FixJ family response regulator
LIAQHRSNDEIAHQLVLSEKTVRNYVSNVCDKPQVADRAAAILRTREAGMGPRAGR